MLTINLVAMLVIASAPPMPDQFVFLDQVDSTIVQDMRYAGTHNFTGRPLPGYGAARCILTLPAARALMAAQAELRDFGMGFKVYDCYRPQRAVDAFMAWSKVPGDTKARDEFYPDLDKANVFRDGYVAEKSGHSRGSTVDLTVVLLPPSAEPPYHDGQPLVSCTANPAVGPLPRQRRLMLKALLEKHGFVNYINEWWHFTLRQEPFPATYFDFSIGHP